MTTDLVLVAIGVLGVVALTGLVIVGRHSRTELPDSKPGLPSRDSVSFAPQLSAGNAKSYEGAVEESSTFLIEDPQRPGSSAVLQVIDESDALIDPRAGRRVADEDPRLDFAFDALVASLPAGVEVVERGLKAGQMLRIAGPPELLDGLRDGTLELVDSNGELLGTVRDIASGEFAGQLRFEQLSVINPAGAALAVFQLMAAVTGQYYMNRIDARLAEIEKGLARVEARQKNDNWAKVDSARITAEKIRKLVSDGAFRYETDIGDLQHADTLVQQAFFAANRNLRQTSASWVTSLSEIGERRDLRPGVKFRWVDDGSESEGDVEVYAVAPGTRRKQRKKLLEDMDDRDRSLEDVQMLIESAVLRARIGMMRLLLEANGDIARARSLAATYETTRDEIMSQLEETLTHWRLLKKWDRGELDTLLARMPWIPTDRGKGTKRLKASLDAACNDINELEKYVKQPEKLIPRAPADPVEPSVVEMRRTGSGKLEVHVASMRAPS